MADGEREPDQAEQRNGESEVRGILSGAPCSPGFSAPTGCTSTWNPSTCAPELAGWAPRSPTQVLLVSLLCLSLELIIWWKGVTILGISPPTLCTSAFVQ